MNTEAGPEAEPDYLVYGQLAEEIKACLAAGRPPDLEVLVNQHPDLASQIRQLAATMAVVQQLGHDSANGQDRPAPLDRDRRSSTGCQPQSAALCYGGREDVASQCSRGNGDCTLAPRNQGQAPAASVWSVAARGAEHPCTAALLSTSPSLPANVAIISAFASCWSLRLPLESVLDLWHSVF
jgi:hypothetical protein